MKPMWTEPKLQIFSQVQFDVAKPAETHIRNGTIF